jgi:hypothetical protein
MKDKDQETSEGLNQIFEIINAKGDVGEINEILKNGCADDETENYAPDSEHKRNHNGLGPGA